MYAWTNIIFIREGLPGKVKRENKKQAVFLLHHKYLLKAKNILILKSLTVQ